jgi:(p)ppGpp synthase/HD superfamily hydrolase
VASKTERRHPLSFTRHLPLTQAAVDFARERHAGQTRAAGGAPFVVHPIEAASILERSRYPDQVVAAAVLHDVLEDTETDIQELKDLFGPEVAELVATMTDDASIVDEDERRREVRDHVRRAGAYAPAIYAADKASKVRELRVLLARGADPAEAESKRRHYRESLAMLEDMIPGSRVVELLRFELEALDELPPA